MQITQAPVFRAPRHLQTTHRTAGMESQDFGSNDIDEENFTWGQLGKGLVGSVIGGTIVGAGGAFAGLTKTPRITYEAIKGVWSSKKLGPVLKTTVTPVLLAAGLAAPVFTTIGAVGWGMVEGFTEAAEKNPLEAGKRGVEIVKDMRGKFSHKIIDGIREAAAEEPSGPDDVWEIKIIEGLKGLAASTVGTAIGGVGIGVVTALNTPGVYIKMSKEMWKSDAALPLKVGGQVLMTAGAALAIPLGFVGGALYGLGMGAYNGYQEGFGKAVVETTKGVGDWHELCREVVNDD